MLPFFFFCFVERYLGMYRVDKWKLSSLIFGLWRSRMVVYTGRNVCWECLSDRKYRYVCNSCKRFIAWRYLGIYLTYLLWYLPDLGPVISTPLLDAEVIRVKCQCIFPICTANIVQD